ncbi:DinB family protein [Actinokineospora pegani]|uniref:DinB family protein n=1 Tax=Actinokineospora pegani TaxID=2654637 RepID=UPI0012EAACBB|nr:DinB family protein [Actinokineospora pegani]
MDWNGELLDQLDYHWNTQLRPRLEGLTDHEYLWEPVADCWTIRPRASDDQWGTGPFTIDYTYPEPEPAPVATIAWRIAHIVVGVFGVRSAAHFGGPPTAYETYAYPGDAATALHDLDEAYATWVAGVRALDEDGLARPCGPAENNWGHKPMATLILHIHREAIHHGAEIALLRDLYLRR